VKCYIWIIVLYRAEDWNTSESRSEIPGKFKMPCRRMEIIWTDRVRNEKVLREVEDSNGFMTGRHGRSD
jgi:hypothetical protein